MYNKFNKIHLIGIGGIGMSGIAQLLRRYGYRVSGSDLVKGEGARALESLGIEVFEGHRPENIATADLVVYSSAISPENPERVASTKKGIPTIPRAEMLAELMRIKYGIAVAGAHGKTTTTSMIALILTSANLDPTIVVGGRMDNFGGTNARLGAGDFMVVEADESDGSFNRLSPCIAIVTNLDREHMDFYKTMRKLKAAFLSFLNKVPFYGLSAVCIDDPYLRLFSHRLERRKATYGFSPDADYQILEYTSKESGTQCRVRTPEGIVSLSLAVPGKHNALNAVAALIVADELNVPRTVALDALRRFEGVQRRFHRRGSLKGVQFIDDYAHHPTEIRATLAAARERFPKSRIRVVFQPHRYSRVDDLLDRFASCFHEADEVAITDIYGAGETQIPGIHAELLVELTQRHLTDKVVRYVSSPKSAIQDFMGNSKDGDIILTMGAGDLPHVYKDLF